MALRKGSLLFAVFYSVLAWYILASKPLVLNTQVTHNQVQVVEVMPGIANLTLEEERRISFPAHRLACLRLAQALHALSGSVGAFFLPFLHVRHYAN